MALTQAEVANVRAKFDGALDALARQKAGTFRGNFDQPMNNFLSAFFDIVRNPVSCPVHADMLYRAAVFLMAEGPESYLGTVDEAIDDALDAAMEWADPREEALLALARHRLTQQRLDA